MQQEELKPLYEITVTISRVLCDGGYRPFTITAYPIKIKCENTRFKTLKQLKDYYGIKSVTKTGKQDWAVGSRKTYYWNVYEAKVSSSFIIN